VAFYDAGGLPSEVLPPQIYRPRLSRAERADLTAFLRYVTGADLDILIADAFAAPIGLGQRERSERSLPPSPCVLRARIAGNPYGARRSACLGSSSEPAPNRIFYHRVSAAAGLARRFTPCLALRAAPPVRSSATTRALDRLGEVHLGKRPSGPLPAVSALP
jgi:hypothetical protein